MTIVSREEKLVAQMKNIEQMLSSGETAETKVYLVTQQMSYINELVNAFIEPLREEAGKSMLIEMVEDTFVHFC